MSARRLFAAAGAARGRRGIARGGLVGDVSVDPFAQREQGAVLRAPLPTLLLLEQVLDLMTVGAGGWWLVAGGWWLVAGA